MLPRSRCRSFVLALAALAAMLVPVAPAQVVVIPPEGGDLQAAIDAAPAGATLVVQGGQWLPIVIDKPLTLIGDPRPILLPDGLGPTALSPIRLDGPGSGTVRLVNLHLGGSVDGTFYAACAPSLAGGGFDALHVFDSFVEGAPWHFAYNDLFPGADAIRVDVPFVWVERSTVRGADAAAGTNARFSASYDAGDGLVAPGTVVLLDSTVRGGDGPTLAWDDAGAGGCPPACPGGSGGDGLVCAVLYTAASTTAGGSGSRWLDAAGTVPCCDGPAGTALTAGAVSEFAGTLSAPFPPQLGQIYSLSWSVDGPAALLFASAGVASEPQFGTAQLFLRPPLFLATVLPPSASVDSSLPIEPALVGIELAAQLFTTGGWTRPVAGVIAP